MLMTACDLGAVTKPWEISRKASIGSHTFVSSFVLLLIICMHIYIPLYVLYVCVLVKVAELVTSEFFEQGDRERSELKLTPSVSLVCFSRLPQSLIHPHATSLFTSASFFCMSARIKKAFLLSYIV